MKSNKVIIINIFTAIFLSLIYYLSLPVSIFKSLPMGDTPIFEYFGYAMNKGELPYLNLFDHKGIFIFLAHYIGFLINGEQGIKLLFTIFVFVSLVYSFKISLLITKRILAAIFTVIIIFLNYMYVSELGLNVETLALPLITASLYIYLKYFINKTINKLEIIFLGIMFFITFFTRANMITVWLLFTIVIFFKTLRNKELKFLISYFLYFILGVSIILLPILIYTLRNSIFEEMIYQSLYVNFTYAGGAGIGKENLLIWLINLLSEMNIILIVIGVLIFNRNNKRNFIYLIMVLIALLLAFLSKRNYYHYLIVVLPFFIPYIANIFKLIFEKINNSIIKILILSLGVYISYQGSVHYIFNSIKEREHIKTDFEQVSNYINSNTNENEKIYAHRLTGSIYLQAERMSSTKYFFIPSINEELYFNELVTDLKNKKPKYIIINESYLSTTKIDKFIIEYTRKNYLLETTISEFKVYKLAA